MHILVTCPFGLSSLVSKELKRLQLQPQTTLETAILLDTDRKGIYAINLRSRIANKVYLIVAEKELLTFDQLFDTVAAIDRKHYLSTGNISVQVTTKHSQLSSQRTIQSVAHKAILTSLQPIEGGDSPQTPTYEIFIHIENNQAKICLNTSGASLHQRGWRTQTGPAPLKENIAAAMVLLSGWKFKAPLIDPCCGSGTILIEAAMIAKNIAPGLQRTFAFQSFPNFDQQLRNDLVHQAKESIYNASYQLMGYDRDTKVIAFAQQNAQNAGVADCVTFVHKEFGTSLHSSSFGGACEEESSGCLLDSSLQSDIIRLLSNPPYGKRLSNSEDLLPLYTTLAAYLQKSYGGLISSYPEMKTLFSPKEFSHKQLYNGADKVDFYWKKL